MNPNKTSLIYQRSDVVAIALTRSGAGGYRVRVMEKLIAGPPSYEGDSSKPIAQKIRERRAQNAREMKEATEADIQKRREWTLNMIRNNIDMLAKCTHPTDIIIPFGHKDYNLRYYTTFKEHFPEEEITVRVLRGRTGIVIQIYPYKRRNCLCAYV